MSLDSGLFLLMLVLILGIAMMPIQFCFSLQYQTIWDFNLSIQIWKLKKTIKISDQTRQKLDLFLTKTYENQEPIQNSLQIHWKSTINFLHKAVQIVSKRIFLQQLLIYCHIGLNRADYTAYAYGLFWSMISLLPIQWQKNSEIIFIPDFQAQKKEIFLKGIICCRAGQVIGIVIALFRLTVQMILEQNRKEQNEYEN